MKIVRLSLIGIISIVVAYLCTITIYEQIRDFKDITYSYIDNVYEFEIFNKRTTIEAHKHSLNDKFIVDTKGPRGLIYSLQVNSQTYYDNEVGDVIKLKMDERGLHSLNNNFELRFTDNSVTILIRLFLSVLLFLLGLLLLNTDNYEPGLLYLNNSVVSVMWVNCVLLPLTILMIFLPAIYSFGLTKIFIP